MKNNNVSRFNGMSKSEKLSKCLNNFKNKNRLDENIKTAFRDKLNGSSINAFFNWILSNQSDSEISGITDTLITKFYNSLHPISSTNITEKVAVNNTEPIKEKILAQESSNKKPEEQQNKFSGTIRGGVCEAIRKPEDKKVEDKKVEDKKPETKDSKPSEKTESNKTDSYSEFFDSVSKLIESFIRESEHIDEKKTEKPEDKKVEDKKPETKDSKPTEKKKEYTNLEEFLNDMFKNHPFVVKKVDDTKMREILDNMFMSHPIEMFRCHPLDNMFRNSLFDNYDYFDMFNNRGRKFDSDLVRSLFF